MPVHDALWLWAAIIITVLIAWPIIKQQRDELIDKEDEDRW